MTEAWLIENDNGSFVNIAGYILIRSDRSDAVGKKCVGESACS